MTKRNQNRPGYKETKVGWIPNRWYLSDLSKIGCKVIDGDRGREYPKETDFISRGHCLFLNASNISKDGLNFDKCSFISIEKHQKLRKGAVCKDDIVITTRGTVGNLAHFNDDLTFDVIRINSGMAIIRIESNSIYKAYIYNVLKSHVIQNQIKRIVFGSAQPQLTIGLINKFRIPLPPLPEQKKIAEILSAWDRAIEQTRKLIDARKRLKKGLMQQLLTGRMRFPEFIKSTDRLSSHFYDYPKDWQHPCISEIAKEITNRNWKKADHPVISCSKYEGFVNSLDYFGKKVFSDDTSNYKIIEKYQFGFPSNHVEEGSIGLLTRVDRGILSPIYIVFDTDRSFVYPPYLYSLFKTEIYKHIFSSNTNASVNRRGSLRWKEFSKIRVPLPAIEEQIKIQSTLDSIDKEIDQLTKKERLISDQKKGLMQKLLTGEIRTIKN